MQCKHCGAEIHGNPTRCPECDGRLKKNKPIWPLRLLMNVISMLFYLVLTVSLFASVLLTDLYLISSGSGIETVLSYIVNQDSEPQPDLPSSPSTETFSPIQLSSIVWDESTTGTAEEPSEEVLPPISLEDLNDADALVEHFGSLTQDFLGNNVSISPEQMKTLITESTMMAFISDKVSSYMNDAVSGTHTTEITADEILALIEENEQLLEETLNIDITEETKASLYQQIDSTIAENNLNEVIRTNMNAVMDEPIPGFGNLCIRDILIKIQELAQPKYLVMGYGLSLLLIVLICLLNYYKLPRGLRWSGSACLTVATPLCIPLLIAWFAPMVLQELFPAAANMMILIQGSLQVFAPMHLGLFALGVVLMVLSYCSRLFYRLYR